MSNAEKYIDLADPIVNEDLRRPIAGVYAALRWLDEHPDQAPGQTITESEFDEIAGTSSPARREDFRRFLKRKNFTVVPDPEPTNAEKLADAMKSAYDQIVGGYSFLGVYKLIAESLDEAGVKAPEDGGGDE